MSCRDLQYELLGCHGVGEHVFETCTMVISHFDDRRSGIT